MSTIEAVLRVGGGIGGDGGVEGNGERRMEVIGVEVEPGVET